ncbi:DEAD/DEAH box helicase family protein [Georgenia sp. SUBG003]|uniref:DEAD/DEAH box helicase family protein n=1 Tax=Georgenia sp. SUBG003 TaxID=1497974 RepID=UPI003AB33246
MESIVDMRWAEVEEGLAPLVAARADQCLAAYVEDPTRIEEDARKEIASAEGGYGRKQIHELVQNAADAMRRAPGTIEVRLTDDVLYVANEGEPFSEAGVVALLYSHLSRKADDQIGRFGLGFKSVTAISSSPQIFSRSGSFGFDKARSEAVIRSKVPAAPMIPALRVAWALSPSEWAARDAILADLMQWATTVVRIPLERGQNHLLEDLTSFPTQLLLFADHVRRLRLVAPDRSVREATVVMASDDERVLQEGRSKTRWRVFSREHRPSPRALTDAGSVRARESIELSWAVPLEGRIGLGDFWSYFPVDEHTTLSGLINSQWKLTDDRVSLLKGPFNEEILTQVLPELVADALPTLHEQVGAAYLDLLPARGREIQGWSDTVLNEPVYARLRQVPSLPDVDGVLRPPAEVSLHPPELPTEWKERWVRRPPVSGTWVSHEVDASTTRRSRAERLLTEGSREPGLRAWIEALAADGTAAGSVHALGLVGAILLEGTPEQAEEARQAVVALLENGQVVPPRPGHVFLRTTLGEDGVFVHPEVAADPEAVETLRRLGVGPLDPVGLLRRELAASEDWERIWQHTRSLDAKVAVQALRDALPGLPEETVQVRVESGAWKPLGSVLRRGAVFPGDQTQDRDFVVDERFHRQDFECLEALGLSDRPKPRSNAPVEAWFRAYEHHARTGFINSLKGPRPQPEKVVVNGPTPPLYPLEFLPELSPEGRARLTATALRSASPIEWTVAHQTNKNYGRKSLVPPDYWWLQRHGRLRTVLGPWPLTKCLAPEPSDGDPRLASFLPVPLDTVHGNAQYLGMVTALEDIDAEDWASIVQAAEERLDDAALSAAYAWASQFVSAPPTVLAHVGNRRQRCTPADVAVTEDRSTFAALRQGRIPVLLVDGDDYADVLVDEWGMREASDLVGFEYVAEPRGESELLVDRFPSMRMWLDPEQWPSIVIQECASIELAITTPAGRDTSVRTSARDSDGKVFFTAEEPGEALAQIAEELGIELSDEDLRAILDQEQQRRTSTLATEIREAGDDLDRLVLAVGEEALRREVPATTLAAVHDQGKPVLPRDLATFAMAIHGYGLLGHLRAVLAERGLNPPERWNGTARARQFVADLGFGLEWAGFPDDGERGATLSVEGPARPFPLHDYQQYVAGNIRKMVRGEGQGRGLVALPTGAGKTRVAVQALTEALAAGELKGPVIWIAQTDELCEQAVQSWASIWRAFGSPDMTLSISRFWGSNTIAEHPEAAEVVVSTPQTLMNAQSSPSYQWLTGADMVVVDEAHTSVAPMYTAVLDWLGRGRSRRERRLLLGLTATPFRGTNEAETHRLVRRYDDNRLEKGAFDGDMYRALQDKGILARVNQRVLDGSELSLNYQELTELQDRRLLPKGVEQRLGQDLARNQRIVQSIVDLPEDWTVLLFATSVENAESLAAQLAYAGVPAAAVSGATKAAYRRDVVRRFRARELRVLTNYSVLTQGFDAPEVRAVYVTRPTWSPNLYQQMIGRGLRGPKNGGSELVDIINVADNVNEYGEQLAFSHFDYLWSTSR